MHRGASIFPLVWPRRREKFLSRVKSGKRIDRLIYGMYYDRDTAWTWVKRVPCFTDVDSTSPQSRRESVPFARRFRPLSRSLKVRLTLNFPTLEKMESPFPQREHSARKQYPVGLYNTLARGRRRKMLEINPRCMLALIEYIEYIWETRRVSGTAIHLRIFHIYSINI